MITTGHVKWWNVRTILNYELLIAEGNLNPEDLTILLSDEELNQNFHYFSFYSLKLSKKTLFKEKKYK